MLWSWPICLRPCFEPRRIVAFVDMDMHWVIRTIRAIIFRERPSQPTRINPNNVVAALGGVAPINILRDNFADNGLPPTVQAFVDNVSQKVLQPRRG
ncbi:hypothetical protein [Ruegeria lacuscaerulensis]|uniref:hypothetical protein n=1 Tax=Ruegeria lacuscaerulensis TaxID=55218 RepID=UPI0014815279|nr:hypothetical protein [Ruegeria lacuscaerulensis]